MPAAGLVAERRIFGTVDCELGLALLRAKRPCGLVTHLAYLGTLATLMVAAVIR